MRLDLDCGLALSLQAVDEILALVSKDVSLSAWRDAGGTNHVRSQALVARQLAQGEAANRRYLNVTRLQLKGYREIELPVSKSVFTKRWSVAKPGKLVPRKSKDSLYAVPVLATPYFRRGRAGGGVILARFRACHSSRHCGRSRRRATLAGRRAGFFCRGQIHPHTSNNAASVRGTRQQGTITTAYTLGLFLVKSG